MREVKANIRFKDKECDDRWRVPGERWKVSKDRAWELTQTKYNNTHFCDYSDIPWDDEKGERVLIYNHDLYKIGGTETFLYNLCKYYKDKNIVLVYKSGKPEYINLLRNYVEVYRDDEKRLYECDVLLMGNFFSASIEPRVKARKKYQMVHADYEGMREAGWNLELKCPKNTQLISVSDIAARGLKKEFGYDSIVQYNILDKELEKEDPIVFISLTRATREKGIHRIISLCELFRKHNKKFLWLLCGTIIEQSNSEIKEKIASIPEIILIPSHHNNKALIKGADYLVQLSDTESFCYSAYEALQLNKPVILTDFPEALNIVIPGKNGYIIPRDEKKYNKTLVNKIFNKVPDKVSYVDRCDYDLWEDIFSGKDIK